jgi:hypothetical protein
LYFVTKAGGNGAQGLIVVSYVPLPAPTISSVSPSSGPTGGGQGVTVTGSGFTNVTSVDIGGAPLTSVSVNSTTSITGVTSAGAAGTYNAHVYVSGGVASPATGGSYTYVTPPSVSSASPSSGTTLGGTAVTISGANMSGVSSVTFGGAAATGISASASSVTCTTPAHAAGLVNVVITNAYGSANANIFTYVTPPALSAIASPVPANGLIFGGTAVTINGTNLTGTSSVTFGGTAATDVVVTATTITCKTPAHARGLVNVVVTNPYGSATLTNAFEYLLPASGFNMPMMGV